MIEIDPAHDLARPAALLRWYLDVGVDECLDEHPIDRFAEVVSPVPTAPVPAPAAAPEPLGASAVQAAVDAARAARDLAELRAAVEAFEGCALKKTAMNTVFADGDPAGPLMLIGEAPGADEDRRGLPFVGASGKLLDQMLASIGLGRERGAYITNIVFWRPPGNRSPALHEVEACRPFVERHIELVAPKVLVLLGRPAVQAVLGRSEAITRLNGQWLTYESPAMSHPVPAMALYHPAYLLRTPGQKRAVWRGLVALRRKLDGL